MYKSDPNGNLISSANHSLLGKWKLDFTLNILDISSDGRYFVSVEQDFCNVTLFNRNGRRWANNPGSNTNFYSFAISADGQYFVAITTGENSVYLFYNPLPSQPNPLLLLLEMQQAGAGDLLIIIFSIIGIGAAAVIIFVVLKKRE